MKIAFVNTVSIWGGGEHWTLQSALELRRRGHDVWLIAAADGALIQKAQAVDLLCSGLPRSLHEQAARILKWRAEFSSFPPQVWLANCIQDVWLVNWVQLLQRKAPIVYRRGLDHAIGDNFIHRWRFQNVNLILANSHATRRTIRRSFPWFPEERIETIYNAAETDRFLWFPSRDLRAELQIPAGAFVIGIVGRLVEQKGHVVLLRALARVLQTRPDTRLLIAGDGPLRQSLQKEAVALKVDRACVFLGHVEPIEPCYRACDVVVVPSLFEGFCFVALEAQLMKRPVVASNTSSLPEVVQEGESGLLVAPGDAEGFARRILELAAQPALRATMGARARHRALEHFSPKPIYDRLENLLLQCQGSDFRGQGFRA